MDVVLLKAVDRLGPEGTVVRVKTGYARNFLLPMGLAAPATAQQMKAVEEMKRQRTQKTERVKAQAEALKRKLEGQPVTLKLTLGADDKPFGSVTAHDVIQALAQDGFDIEKHALHLEQPITTLGIFELPVGLHPEVTAIVKVWVVKA